MARKLQLGEGKQSYTQNCEKPAGILLNGWYRSHEGHYMSYC